MTARKIFFVIVCLAGVGVLLLFTQQPDSMVEPAVETRGTETNAIEATVAVSKARPIVADANGYLGSAACKDCHADQFQSWHRSYHRTMTQVISEQTAPDAIRNTTVDVDGQVYRFRQRGEKFFVQLNDPTVGGSPRERELVMMTGSHHMHVLWYESDFERTPAQLPILFLKDQQRWIPRRSAFLQPPDIPVSVELGRWNQVCSKCHSTNPRMRLQPESHVWDTHVAEFGIACEACHGPGETHVAFYETNATTSEQSLVGRDQVVNPVSLPHDAKSHVCGQCHGVGLLNFDEMSEEDYLANGSPFRPGATIEETPFCSIVQASPEHWQTDTFKRFAKMPNHLAGHFWPDGEVRVSGREYNGLLESKCFQEGDMSCLSCHTMHEQDLERQAEWRNDQLKTAMNGDQACLQCHAEYEQLGASHTHHPVGSTGSQCMNCHMPHTVFGLLKTIRSHRVSSPSVESTVKTSRPNACNLCHLDKTLKWSSGHLTTWYGQKEVKLTKDEQTIAASVLQLLKGDAGQRAIQVSALGSAEAREASGAEWIAPFLLLGMNDSYEAIRLIAERSLRSLEGWSDIEYEFLDSAQDRARVTVEKAKQFQMPELAGRTELLMDQEGGLDMPRVEDLIKRQNQRPVELLE
ncbi:MAG: multiheme c-type cytochrome [Rubripirellula sp.]